MHPSQLPSNGKLLSYRMKSSSSNNLDAYAKKQLYRCRSRRSGSGSRCDRRSHEDRPFDSQSSDEEDEDNTTVDCNEEERALDRFKRNESTYSSWRAEMRCKEGATTTNAKPETRRGVDVGGNLNGQPTTSSEALYQERERLQRRLRANRATSPNESMGPSLVRNVDEIERPHQAGTDRHTNPQCSGQETGNSSGTKRQNHGVKTPRPTRATLAEESTFDENMPDSSTPKREDPMKIKEPRSFKGRVGTAMEAVLRDQDRIQSRLRAIRSSARRVSEQSLASSKANSSTSLGSEAKVEKEPKKKIVKFSHVEVRSYERILGDNPSCSSGPPMSIGWKFYEEETRTYTVREHQRKKPWAENREWDDDECPILSRDTRIDFFLEMGYSEKDLAKVIRSILKTKRQRRQTVVNLDKMELEEKVEKAGRSMKRAVFGRNDATKQKSRFSEAA